MVIARDEKTIDGKYLAIFNSIYIPHNFFFYKWILIVTDVENLLVLTTMLYIREIHEQFELFLKNAQSWNINKCSAIDWIKLLCCMYLNKMKLNNTIKHGKGMKMVDDNNVYDFSCQLTPENKDYLWMIKEYIKQKEGAGLVNAALRNLPIPEMHISLRRYVSYENLPSGSFANTDKYS